MLFICYPRCSTCKKAKLWLTERGIKFEERDIKLENFEKKNLASQLYCDKLYYNKLYPETAKGNLNVYRQRKRAEHTQSKNKFK